MPDKANLAPPSLVRETWDALPEGTRTYEAVAKVLIEAGFDVPSRSGFYKNKRKWARPPASLPEPVPVPAPIVMAPPVTVQSAMLAGPTAPPPVPKPPRPPAPVETDEATPLIGEVVAKVVAEVAPQPKVSTTNVPVNMAAIESLPSELVDALGLRMLIVAKGQGLDRVEDAIVKVASAIAGQAAEIAKGLLEAVPEDQPSNPARNAVQSLATLAEAMHRITSSRMLFSLGYRNYSEGDRLSGEGAKFRAEAEVIENTGRADNAKEIPGSYQQVSGEEEDDAISAMRDLESRDPK